MNSFNGLFDRFAILILLNNPRKIANIHVVVNSTQVGVQRSSWNC